MAIFRCDGEVIGIVIRDDVIEVGRGLEADLASILVDIELAFIIAGEGCSGSATVRHFGCFA
ncbi:MAG: hypothetical protein HRT82_01525 [Henriciella sp.]|nr:hypothetical protein [Henriciella sp.]